MMALGLLHLGTGVLSGAFAAAAGAVLREEWAAQGVPDRAVRVGLLGFLIFEAALLLASGLLFIKGEI